MAEVHKLLKEHGREGALKSDIDRRVVEAAAAYMADADGEIGFLYSGWAQAALPHKRLPDDAHWQIQTDRVTLIVQPGLRAVRDSEPVSVGVPYGSRARLIMLFLQTEALRTGSREIELGRSLHAWLRRLEIPIGGKSMKDVPRSSRAYFSVPDDPANQSWKPCRSGKSEHPRYIDVRKRRFCSRGAVHRNSTALRNFLRTSTKASHPH